ncbi:uncharacterized protein LOC120004040 isoform X2 [Tripterygium wilfordii]|uniref:uncharacterized protein LOC120004040 isoform X2 n=1 Tax=Tripterygium wilfordii TaxID=458696 RepID=UPI0018F83177|nr:uncharacterized protein LOC120004040 isoform X2 [Tripterygium wilfordii]
MNCLHKPPLHDCSLCLILLMLLDAGLSQFLTSSPLLHTKQPRYNSLSRPGRFANAEAKPSIVVVKIESYHVIHEGCPGTCYSLCSSNSDSI